MKPLLRLGPYLKPFFWLILISVVLAIPLSALRATPVFLVKHVLDDLLIAKDRVRLLWFPALVIGLYVANFVIRFFHYYLLRVVVARVNQRLKNDLFEHLIGLSAEHFSSQRVGELISRVGSDPERIVTGLNSFTAIIREPLTFITLFAYALYLNWQLTLVTFLIMPLLAWVFATTGRNLKRYIASIAEENANLFSTLQETFSGVRVVQMFRLEKYVRKKFRERAEVYTQYILKSAVLEEISHPLVELLTAFLIAAVVYYGGLQVIEGKLTQGELLSFFAAFALMLHPLRTINDVNIKLNQASASCARVFEVLDWKSNIIEKTNAARVAHFQTEIRFENVTFAYPDAPSRVILKKISFEVPKGKVIALAGPSGAGKSSVVSLIPRVFDVTDGKILLDGKDIRDLELDDLRKLIAVVSQDVFLFNDTIEENIRCGRLSATSEEIREAARQAHALEFIESLPGGFKAKIGERGQKLSGGERQRLSIARAFLRHAPILILDEATSSLDTKSERMVQSALEELMRNRTTLVIAHRLSTIRAADEILVIKEGEIAERGTHEELLKNASGVYARLHQFYAT